MSLGKELLCFTFLFTGSFKNKINTAIYTILFFSFVIMQTYVEWQKYQMRKHEMTSSGLAPEQDVLTKTGTFSFLAVFLCVGHISLVYLTPDAVRSLSFYIAKVGCQR